MQDHHANLILELTGLKLKTFGREFVRDACIACHGEDLKIPSRSGGTARSFSTQIARDRICRNRIDAFKVACDGLTIAGGDWSGRMHFLKLEGNEARRQQADWGTHTASISLNEKVSKSYPLGEFLREATISFLYVGPWLHDLVLSGLQASQMF